MGNVVWLLVAIPVIVYVLGSLARGKTKPSEEESDTTRTDPSASDVERFLAEINRRREAGRGAERPAPARPEPRPVRQRPRDGGEAARGERPRTPVVRRVSDDQARQLPTVELVAPVVIPELAAFPPAPGPDFAPRVAARLDSPLMNQVLPLLRSPDTLRAAMVLQEIIGPPRCRRRSGTRSNRP